VIDATQSQAEAAWQESPQLEVVIEIPRGSFLKRGSTEQLDFISPLPCPFNYGAVDDYIGLDGDLLDALVLGSRLPRGARVQVKALGAVGLRDRDMYDDKLVCSQRPIRRWQRVIVLLFFHFYGRCKRLLNFYRGLRGRTMCEGWGDAREAIARAQPRNGVWQGPTTPF
jgi:inorganic pyrophosphatase